MRRLLTATALAYLLVVAGCDDVAPPPGESTVDVDTPELRALKAEAGVEDCVAGPGGGSLPDLILPCLGGGTEVDLSTLTGPLVINTWASNCGPCRDEMPALQDFYERYGDRVGVLGIDFVDVQPQAALDLVKHTGVTYPLLADPGGDLLDQDDVRVAPGNPQFILLDADGEVAYQVAGGIDSADEVVAMVKDHLGIDL